VMCTRHRHQHELEQDKQLLRNSKSSGRDPHTSSSFGPQPCGSAGSKERISQDSEDGWVAAPGSDICVAAEHAAYALGSQHVQLDALFMNP
jgi:hypothetical protein